MHVQPGVEPKPIDQAGDLNAAMGVIVAAPTAGGAGVLPAVLTGLARERKIADEKVIDALATAGLIGAVVAERASLSGAEGGCQAETGAAAGMAAGAATEMLGKVADEALQIHGGMGLMDELVLERIWRDARVERIWDGTSEIQRHIVSRSMLRAHGG